MSVILFAFVWWLVGFTGLFGYMMFEFFVKQDFKKDFTLNDLLVAMAGGAIGPVALFLSIGFFVLDLWEMIFVDKKFGDIVLFRKKD